MFGETTKERGLVLIRNLSSVLSLRLFGRTTGPSPKAGSSGELLFWKLTKAGQVLFGRSPRLVLGESYFFLNFPPMLNKQKLLQLSAVSKITEKY